MKLSESSASLPLTIPWSRLLSLMLLATGMLLASTMTLKASWLWVLAPVALLMLLDITSAPKGSHFALVSFYGGLLAMALAFNFVGLAPATPTLTATRTVIAKNAGDTCGSGGCGTSAGCGTGGCGASSGASCSCSSGKTGKVVAAPIRVGPPPSVSGFRPVAASGPNRNGNGSVKVNGPTTGFPTRPPGTSVNIAPRPAASSAVTPATSPRPAGPASAQKPVLASSPAPTTVPPATSTPIPPAAPGSGSNAAARPATPSK